jgi:hypothetical protein
MPVSDQPVVTSTHTKEPREDKGRQYMEQSPPQAAAATAWTGQYMPALSIPESVAPPTPSPTMPCLLSPCAPQVENYALVAVSIPSNLEQETLMPGKQAGPATRVERPQTRRIARVERLIIPSSLEISDSKEKHAPVTRPHKRLCPHTEQPRSFPNEKRQQSSREKSCENSRKL